MTRLAGLRTLQDLYARRTGQDGDAILEARMAIIARRDDADARGELKKMLRDLLTVVAHRERSRS